MHLKGIVCQFELYTYSLSCQELEEKIATTLASVTGLMSLGEMGEAVYIGNAKSKPLVSLRSYQGLGQ